MALDDLGPLGPARLFALARILLHGQVALGLIGSLSFVYGTIHPGETPHGTTNLALPFRSPTHHTPVLSVSVVENFLKAPHSPPSGAKREIVESVTVRENNEPTRC
jgi:hypothetical protein